MVTVSQSRSSCGRPMNKRRGICWLKVSMFFKWIIFVLRIVEADDEEEEEEVEIDPVGEDGGLSVCSVSELAGKVEGEEEEEQPATGD